MASDRGNDQVACDNVIGDEVEPDGWTWFLATFCMMHTSQCIVRGQLARGGQHFSSIAKITNVWRSCGFATLAQECADEIFGKDSVLRKLLKKLINRPLRGRWLAITAAEDYLLGLGREAQFLFYY